MLLIQYFQALYANPSNKTCYPMTTAQNNRVIIVNKRHLNKNHKFNMTVNDSTLFQLN